MSEAGQSTISDETGPARPKRGRRRRLALLLATALLLLIVQTLFAPFAGKAPSALAILPRDGDFYLQVDDAAASLEALHQDPACLALLESRAALNLFSLLTGASDGSGAEPIRGGEAEIAALQDRLGGEWTLAGRSRPIAERADPLPSFSFGDRRGEFPWEWLVLAWRAEDWKPRALLRHARGDDWLGRWIAGRLPAEWQARLHEDRIEIGAPAALLGAAAFRRLRPPESLWIALDRDLVLVSTRSDVLDACLARSRRGGEATLPALWPEGSDGIRAWASAALCDEASGRLEAGDGESPFGLDLLPSFLGIDAGLGLALGLENRTPSAVEILGRRSDAAAFEAEAPAADASRTPADAGDLVRLETPGGPRELARTLYTIWAERLPPDRLRRRDPGAFDTREAAVADRDPDALEKGLRALLEALPEGPGRTLLRARPASVAGAGLPAITVEWQLEGGAEPAWPAALDLALAPADEDGFRCLESLPGTCGKAAFLRSPKVWTWTNDRDARWDPSEAVGSASKSSQETVYVDLAALGREWERQRRAARQPTERSLREAAAALSREIDAALGSRPVKPSAAEHDRLLRERLLIWQDQRLARMGQERSAANLAIAALIETDLRLHAAIGRDRAGNRRLGLRLEKGRP